MGPLVFLVGSEALGFRLRTWGRFQAFTFRAVLSFGGWGLLNPKP